MPDMISIMARALCDADEGGNTDLIFQATEHHGDCTKEIFTCSLCQVEDYTTLAKAVRDALRTPTDAMTRAGASVPIPPPGMPSMEASRLVWQAHVDAMETEGAGDE